MITGAEVREAIGEVVSSIVAAIRQALENTPPELSGDIIQRGISLAGGGANLKGLDKLIQQELSIAVRIADDPLARQQAVDKAVDDAARASGRSTGGRGGMRGGKSRYGGRK